MGQRLRRRARWCRSSRSASRRTLITDAGQRLSGTVTFISPKAEFTPRNVQTAEERSKLVYRVKVTADNRDGVLKPGMPVEAELAPQPAERANDRRACRAIVFDAVTRRYGAVTAIDRAVVRRRAPARCSA